MPMSQITKEFSLILSPNKRNLFTRRDASPYKCDTCVWVTADEGAQYTYAILIVELEGRRHFVASSVLNGSFLAIVSAFTASILDDPHSSASLRVIHFTRHGVVTKLCLIFGAPR